MDYYKDIDKFISNNWSLKDESLKYLQDNLNSLYQVIVKANKQVFIDYSVNMIDSKTISSLAKQIFIKSHYKNYTYITNFLQKLFVFNFLFESYLFVYYLFLMHFYLVQIQNLVLI